MSESNFRKVIANLNIVFIESAVHVIEVKKDEWLLRTLKIVLSITV